MYDAVKAVEVYLRSRARARTPLKQSNVVIKAEWRRNEYKSENGSQTELFFFSVYISLDTKHQPFLNLVFGVVFFFSNSRHRLDGGLMFQLTF